MANKFKFGVSKDIITPSTKTTVMGFGSVYGNYFQSVHDDLYVRTLLLNDATDSVILMSADILFHDDSLVNDLRNYTYEKYGIPKDNLLLTFTHTHYGPVAKGYDFVFNDSEYEKFLYNRMTDSIDRVFLNTYEGTMEYASVEGEWNISRRLKVDGVMQWGLLPNPDGECDKNMYLLRLTDTEGRMRSLVTNFACHPSNLDTYRALSSEYPGRLCHLLEAQNYGCTALFFQGSGADAKLKIGAKSSKFSPISYDECNEVATAMALRIQNTLQSGKWQKIDPNLKSKMFKIEMPLDVHPKSFFEKELKEYSGNSNKRFDKSMINPKEYSGSLLMWACAQYVVDRYDELPHYLMLNCGVIRLCENFYIFTVGGEPSYDVKKVLNQLIPDDGNMLFFGYNDAIAYVPSDKMLEEGGYEAGDRSATEYRMKGKFKAGIDKRFKKGFKDAMDEINQEM